MTHPHDDEFTRKLNDRIKELEDMTNQIDGQREELEGFAARNTDETTEINDETQEVKDEATASNEERANQAPAPRQEGDTIFFTAKVNPANPLKLTVTNNNGDIDVTGTDSDSVEIEATRVHGEEVDHSHWFFQQLDNEITLRPNWQVGSHVSDLASKIKNQLKEGFKTSQWSSKDFKFGLDVNYDLVVRLPRNLAEGSRINIKTANGDGHLQNVDGNVDFKTANGDLDVTNVAGPLTINSANGDLQATNISGNVNASTANGDVNLTNVTGSIESNTANGDIILSNATGAISLRTANGDISLTEATWKGGRLVTVAGDIHVDAALVKKTTYAFDSVSGDIRVDASVPQGGASLTARSVTGEISTGGDFEKDGKREWKLGDGDGPRISAKSVSSDIHVSARVDSALTLEQGDPANEGADGSATKAEYDEHGVPTFDKGAEINVNLDFELERAKGWLKDVSSKLGTMLSEPPKPPAAPEANTPEPPKAPDAPQTPQNPVSSEQAAATADRRTKLLEAVKNGEMTVDEALAELERDA